jgi:hypothetical protein
MEPMQTPPRRQRAYRAPARTNGLPANSSFPANQPKLNSGGLDVSDGNPNMRNRLFEESKAMTILYSIERFCGVYCEIAA